jgi:hypothetical protein
MKYVPKKKPGPGASPESKRKKWLIALASLLVLFFGGWFMMAGDAQVETLKQEQEELIMNREGMPEEEYRARQAALRAHVESLPREQRREVDRARDRTYMKKENASSAKYFAMSAQDRQLVIAQELARQKQWAEKMKNFKAKGGGGPRGPGGPPGGGGGGPPGGGPGGPGGPGGFRGPGGGGPGGPGGKGGPPNGGAPRPTPTAEQVDNFNRERLIKGTPQSRAGSDQKRLDMAAARAKAGLPPVPTGKGGGGFRGGR